MLWILIFAFLCWVSVKHILCAKSSAGHCRDLHSKWKHRLLWKPPEGAYHTPWGSGRTSEWKLQWKLRPEWQSGKDRMEERRVQAAGPASGQDYDSRGSEEEGNYVWKQKTQGHGQNHSERASVVEKKAKESKDWLLNKANMKWIGHESQWRRMRNDNH